MAWLVVSKENKEFILASKPVRDKHWWKLDNVETDTIELPKGTIAKLLRYDLKWEDEPVELK